MAFTMEKMQASKHDAYMFSGARSVIRCQGDVLFSPAVLLTSPAISLTQGVKNTETNITSLVNDVTDGTHANIKSFVVGK